MNDATQKEIDIFLPYQKEWLNDDNDVIIAEKCRRCGLSWSDGVTPVLRGGRAKRPRNSYYISYNQDMTRQYIHDCADWAKRLNIAAGEMQEVVLKNERLLNNEREDITTYRIELATGKEIVGLPSVPYSLRSKQGDIIIDEAAYVRDLDAVLEAAYAMTIWGGQIRVISTHHGDDNPFNLLIKDIRSGRKPEWNIHRVTFDDAVKQGLYKRICLTSGEDWTAEKETGWIEKIKRIYADNIDEDLNVIPRPSGGRYFGRGLLDLCTQGVVPTARLNCSDAFLHKGDGEKEREIRRFFNVEVAPVLNSLEGQVYFGNDFGRSGDLSTYWISEEAAKTELSVRLIVELKNVPFESQQLLSDLITDALDARGKFGGGAIDSRGNGQQIAEHAMLRHPGAVVAVMESKQWYAKYGPDLHGLMESCNFDVPEDDTIKGDFSIITLQNGVPVIPDIRTADREGKGQRHGDAASAAMLCVCAWRECASDPAPSFDGLGSGDKEFNFFAKGLF